MNSQTNLLLLAICLLTSAFCMVKIPSTPNVDSHLRASWQELDLVSEDKSNESREDFGIFLSENELDDTSEDVRQSIADYFEYYEDDESPNHSETWKRNGQQLLGLKIGSIKKPDIGVSLHQTVVFSPQDLNPTPSSTVSACTDNLTQMIEGPHKEAGKGAFGRIFIPSDTKQNVVIKEMEVGKQSEKLITREIMLSLMFRNVPNVVSYYKACYIDRSGEDMVIRRFYYLFMEKCQQDFGAWFFKHVKEGDAYTLLKVLGAITNGFKEIHSRGVLHIDNHIGNYMVCNKQIKIIDFGISKKVSTLSNMRKKISENLEYNELYNFYKTLVTYSKVKEKHINELLAKLRRNNRDEPQIASIREFDEQLQELYFSFKLNVLQQIHDESSTGIAGVIMGLALALLMFR